MKEVYSWETNTLEITDKYSNHYVLNLRGNRNQIKGDSGTGKTHLYNLIDNIQKDVSNQSNYDAKNIFLVDAVNIEQIYQIKKKLIIIDRADLLLNDEEIDFINGDTDNRYLIFSRVPLGIEMSPNHQADLVTENKVTTLKYRFSVKGWC